MKKSMKKDEHEKIQLQKSSLKSQRHIVQLRTVYCMAKNGISARNFEYVTLSNWKWPQSQLPGGHKDPWKIFWRENPEFWPN